MKEKDLDQIQTFLNYFHVGVTNDSFTRYLVYEMEQKVVGMIEFVVLYERAEINYIYVDPIYRNQNIASQLLKYCFRECENNAVEVITLEVSEKNASALRLYGKNGFSQVAIRKHYYKDGDAILMERKLVVK